jgi:D-alanyl-lipoteichoic acid acyltransferase DltB (MBOAT superfamily)
LWHGTNLYWALWGLLHGMGFCVFMWYRANKGRAILRPLMFFENDFVGRVTTYVFVCMCWALPSKLLAFARL